MEIKHRGAAQALARIDPGTRLFVLGGPDEPGSRALMADIVRPLGKDAERIDVSPAEAKAMPSILADEAAAFGLFGGARWIQLHVPGGGGDEAVAAAEALLAAPAAGNPVIIIGSGITDKGKLAKLVKPHPLAVLIISWPPNPADAVKMAEQMAGEHHLRLSAGVARAVATACAFDRDLIAQEVRKLALYCDAAPGQVAQADMAAWQAIGADLPEEDLGAIVDTVLEGKGERLPEQLDTLAALGTAEIRVVRAVAARALLLARLRALVEQGRSPAAVMEAEGKAIFWKDRDAVGRQLARWQAAPIASVIDRMHMLERALKVTDNPATLLLRDALTTLAHQASRLR